MPATTSIQPQTTTSLPPGYGNIWLTPPGCPGIGYCLDYYGGMSATVGQSFSIDLHMNTGNDVIVGDFGITVTYPQAMVLFVGVQSLLE